MLQKVYTVYGLRSPQGTSVFPDYSAVWNASEKLLFFINMYHFTWEWLGTLLIILLINLIMV